ncbi:hypothetical protein HDU91_002433, partial [Kappamyces sp. JEL0680]
HDRSYVLSAGYGSNSLESCNEPLYLENLRGLRHSNGMLMRDPVDGTIKSFFLFTDLAIRAMGEFRLECTVVDMTR